jgi:phosphoribosylanthranilate isomerase
VKGLRVRGPVDPESLAIAHPRALAFLLDAHVPGVPGGTGVTFDWSYWPARSARPLIVAGGLNAANVADAIVRMRPYAVDVSSGVESGRPGVKDPDKIVRFLSEVARASEGL